MSTQRRGRSESIIKIIKERKESKLLYYEAVAHNRSGNYEKAVNAYSRVSFIYLYFLNMYACMYIRITTILL